MEIVSSPRSPCGSLISQFGFVDEAHLCYEVPFGLVIEHSATGRQRHFWLDHFSDTHGPSTIAFDPANGHIALHKDGPEKTVKIICSHTLDVIDTLVIHTDQAVNGAIQNPSVWQMSFSSDGKNLAVGVQSHVSALWVFSRSSPRGSFVHMCSQRVDVVSRSNPPSFSPGGSDNLCWIGLLSYALGCRTCARHVDSIAAATQNHSDQYTDEGSIHVIRIESVLERIDVKRSQVDVAALAANDSFSAHTWHPNGSLLIGTTGGKLFTVPKAAVPLARSHEMDAATSSMFQLQPCLEQELVKWTAGAIVSLHIVGETLAILFECPDRGGGLLIWAALSSVMGDDCQDYGTTPTDRSREQQSLKAVELPLGQIVFSATSPNQSQMAVMDDMSQVLLLHTSGCADVASFTLASTSHSGSVIGIETVQGTPAAAGILFLTLDVRGVLRAFVMEPGARMENGDVTAKLTLVRSGSLGAPGAAIASHPILPLVVVATVSGQLHLIGTTEFAGCMAQDESLAGAGCDCVHFCASVMQAGNRKDLTWSPDGAVLACLDATNEEIILLKRKASQFQKDKHILSPLNRIAIPNVDHLCWHQPGARMPTVIIHQAQGHLLLLDVPRETGGWNLAPLELQAVLRCSYRLTAPIVDMQLLHPQSSEGHVIIIAACMDCSIRKFRITLERGRTTAKKASSVVLPLAGVEAEVLQVLHGTPTCTAITASFSKLLVGCRSGTLQEIDTTTLQASASSIQVHGNQEDGISALAALAEDCIVSADSAGVMHAINLSVCPRTAPAQPCTGNSQAIQTQQTVIQRPQGGLFDISHAVLAGASGLDMAPRQVLSLTEVLKTMQLRQCERKREKWKDSISSGVQNCAKRLARLKRRNDAVTDDSERLNPDEFIICQQLASRLRNMGMTQAANMKESMRQDTAMEALRATQLLATSRCQMLVQEEALSSIPMYHPVSPSDTITERSQHASSTIELVHNMAMPTALPEQQLHLGQRVFLRRVEQYEWCTRPLQDQGLFAEVNLTTLSDAEDPPNATDQRQQAKASNSINIRRQPLGHEMAYGNVHNGICQLLYAPLQLHLCRRKASQVHLLAVEEREIQSCFNKRFESLRKDKDRVLCKMEEQLARICAIQTELGATQYPEDIILVPEDDESRWIRVEPHELTATKWLSLAERQHNKLEGSRKADQEAAIKGNKSQETALLAMMNGSPERRNKNEIAHVQQRQSWMDMPIKGMSKAQREALKDFERQVQEAEENLRNAQRVLEGERKALEEEISMAIKAFNSDVTKLRNERLRAEVEVAITQQLRLSNGCTLLEITQLIACNQQQDSEDACRKQRASSLKHFIDALKNKVADCHAEYMDVANQCKLLDRSFIKTFQGLGAQFQAALDVYRNTEKCPMYIKYGDRKGTMDAPNPDVVLEGMTAVDHGKIKRDKLMTSVKAETSGEFFGKSSWRPGCSPPMQPTWNHGPPLSADDRPDAIAEPDWTRIMQYRDCRIGQLEKLARAWEAGAEVVATLDAYVAESTCLSNKLQAAHEKSAKLAQDNIDLSVDVPVVFSGYGGQVEITEDQLLPDMQHALLVNRDRINVLNCAIHQQATRVLELLQDCSQLRSKQQGIAWDLSMSDLAAEQKLEHVKELQLFHVTRDVQGVLECNRKQYVPNSSEAKVLDKLRELNKEVQISKVQCKHHVTIMQTSMVKQRSTKLVNLTESVAERLEMNEELSKATEEAFRIIQGHAKVKQLAEQNTADRAARIAIHFKRMAIQNKLRTVALTQTQELLKLFAEKQSLIDRSFPSFRGDI